MRIAIGGFLHESHSFAPLPTRWADFLAPGGFPPLQRPPTLIGAIEGSAVAAAGAIAAARAAGAEIAPLSWAFAYPAGPVQDEAFERFCALLLADLQAAMPLDGLYLDLHGAMLAESFPDGEGELLRRARAILGPDVPIAASLDPHANLTAAMVAHADLLAPYRTYPHVDMKEAGARAMRLLLDRIRRKTPLAKAFRQVDYLIPITSQCTLDGPMAEAMAARAAIEAESGAAELALCFGFPYADFPDCGPAIAAFAARPEAAEAAAAALAAAFARLEPVFAQPILPAAEAVAMALKLASGEGRGPVVIADTQDNPGGGGHGDTTGLLAELVAQGATGAVLGPLNDAASAAAAHAAGEGAEIALALGGASDGAPLAVTARVLRLSDGRFTCTGPMTGGNAADLGPSALLGIGGVEVLVVSRKMQAHDQAIFRHIGVEPAMRRILALKSSVHFRADFGPIASHVLVAAAPGPVVADPAVLPFTRLRPGLRLRPGDRRR